MKKFVIITIVLMLVGAGALGYSTYHYLDVTGALDKATPDEATAATVDEAATTAPATETADNSGAVEGIFAENTDKAVSAVSAMSKEQKVGQLILGICSDTEAAATDLNRYSLAGLYFQNSNFDYMTPDEVKALLSSYTATAKTAPILAVEEEGGYHATVSDHDAFYEYSFDSPRNLYETGGLSAAEAAEDEKADMLSMLGVNLNLAPVVDLPNDISQIMYSRSLCGDANVTAQFAAYVARVSQSKGVSVALKHYPGYGTIPDSYDPVVTDTRDAETIKTVDSVPFKAGIDAGAHFVMMSNVVVESIDPVHTAALSPELHRMLREDLGFSGIIITNQLDAADYSAYSDGRAAAVSAILAGNDMIIVSDYATAYTDLLSAVNDGTIPTSTLDSICTRILAYKYTAGIMK